MAGILFSIGKNVSDKHVILHNDFCNRKKISYCSHLSNGDVFCISKFARLDEHDENIHVGDDISLFCVGTILYKDLIGREAILSIKNELIHNDINEIVGRLDGHFILIIIYHFSDVINIITDHAGMMHAYIYRDGQNIYISTSSAILSKNFNVTLDVDAVVQFLRCDSICDCDTIYNEIKLLDPATIYNYKVDNKVNENKKTYWTSPIHIEEDMSIQEATDIWTETLLDVGKIISQNKVICDLTGGFDSRSILASMLPYVDKEGDDFSTFVFGPDNSGEVKVAKEICSQLKVNNKHLTLPRNWNDLFSEYLMASLSITDGEENTSNYAPISFANKYKKKYYSCSLNGMGGCFLKSFNWLQELTCSKRPAKINRFVKLRSLQYEYNEYVHSDFLQSRISNIHSLLKRQYLNIISDMDFNQSFNSLQLDNIDLRQRERRWGGRTISSSNQILKIIAPLYFKKCLDTAMSIPPGYKKNGRLVKRVISRINPELARQKMLTGMPCEELNSKNLYKFYPIIFVYIFFSYNFFLWSSSSNNIF